MKHKPFRLLLKKHELSKVLPPEESKRAQRRRASMKANAKKAELARVRKAESESDAEYREKRDRYFGNLRMALVGVEE